MNKSVLFVINGFGMGNATRCEGLMDILQDQTSIDVITSDKAYSYFKDNPKIQNLHKQIDINRTNMAPYGSILFFLSYIPYFLVRIYRNYKLQKKIISTNSYSAVFFDSDYSFILHRLTGNNTNIIGINNAAEVLSFFSQNLQYVNVKILASLILEFFDFIVYWLFSRFIICPAIDSANIKIFNFMRSKFLVSPLIVRAAVLNTTVEETKNVLFMSSSSNVRSDLENLSQIFKNRNCIHIGKVFEKSNLKSLQESSVVVCNAGQSSIAECLYLGKKSIVVCIPKHAEQLANAFLAEKKGLFRYKGKIDENLLTQFENFYIGKGQDSNQQSYKILTKIIKDHFKNILN